MSTKESLVILGSRIRETRKACGMSQEGLALQAEIDRSFMGQVERGQRNVSFVTLCKIASVLKTDLGTLRNGLPVGIDSEPSHFNLSEPLTHQRPEAGAN